MKDKIIHGFHAIFANMRAHSRSVHTIYYDSGRYDQRLQRLLDEATKLGVNLIKADSVRLDGLSSTNHHQGVVAICNRKDLSKSLFEVLDSIDHPALLLILDGITDPHNLGACLRVADAAAVDAVIAPRDRSAGINATVERVSCGAAQNVPYIMVTNLSRCLRELKEFGVCLVGTDERAQTSIYEADLRQHVALIFGSENRGMRRLTRENCDLLISLPMLGSVASLNVSVASGICLYEALRQRRR